MQFRTDHGPAHAVDGVSFVVDAGETLCVVGESGCGKSVTALSLMGLLPRPAAQVSGRIAFEGRDLLALDQSALADLRGNRLAMIFQEPMTSLNPAFTVGSQLTEVLVRHRGTKPAEARAAAIEMLRQVRIPAPGGYTIAATILRPAGEGRYGAVVLNHGTPGSASGRARESSELLIHSAAVFARRGYVVVMPMRRGFGATGGEFAEDPGTCANPDYRKGERNAADDVMVAYDFARTLPYVDNQRMILAGQSAGGIVARVDLQRAAVFGERAFTIAALLQQKSQIQMALHQVGHNLECFFVGGDRFIRPSCAGVEDRRAIRGPGGDRTRRGLEGQAPRRTAGRGHHVDLGRALLTADEGQQRAVGRETGMARLADPGGQSPGAPPAGRRHPQVVLGDEDDGVVVQGGKAQVTRLGG